MYTYVYVYAKSHTHTRAHTHTYTHTDRQTRTHTHIMTFCNWFRLFSNSKEFPFQSDQSKIWFCWLAWCQLPFLFVEIQFSWWWNRSFKLHCALLKLHYLLNSPMLSLCNLAKQWWFAPSGQPGEIRVLISCSKCNLSLCLWHFVILKWWLLGVYPCNYSGASLQGAWVF